MTDPILTPAEAGASRWVTVAAAAAFLDLTPGALLRDLERHAYRSEDGTVESNIDGVRARKLGRRWRICFSPAWGVPSPLARVVAQKAER